MPPKPQKQKAKCKEASESLEHLGEVTSRSGKLTYYWYADPKMKDLPFDAKETLVLAKKGSGHNYQSRGTEGVEFFKCGGSLIASYRDPKTDDRTIGIKIAETITLPDGSRIPIIVFLRATKHSTYFKDASSLDPNKANKLLAEATDETSATNPKESVIAQSDVDETEASALTLATEELESVETLSVDAEEEMTATILEPPEFIELLSDLAASTIEEAPFFYRSSPSETVTTHKRKSKAKSSREATSEAKEEVGKADKAPQPPKSPLLDSDVSAIQEESSFKLLADAHSQLKQMVNTFLHDQLKIWQDNWGERYNEYRSRPDRVSDSAPKLSGGRHPEVHMVAKYPKEEKEKLYNMVKYGKDVSKKFNELEATYKDYTAKLLAHSYGFLNFYSPDERGFRNYNISKEDGLNDYPLLIREGQLPMHEIEALQLEQRVVYLKNGEYVFKIYQDGSVMTVTSKTLLPRGTKITHTPIGESETPELSPMEQEEVSGRLVISESERKEFKIIKNLEIALKARLQSSPQTSDAQLDGVPIVSEGEGADTNAPQEIDGSSTTNTLDGHSSSSSSTSSSSSAHQGDPAPTITQSDSLIITQNSNGHTSKKQDRNYDKNEGDGSFNAMYHSIISPASQDEYIEILKNEVQECKDKGFVERAKQIEQEIEFIESTLQPYNFRFEAQQLLTSPVDDANKEQAHPELDTHIKDIAKPSLPDVDGLVLQPEKKLSPSGLGPIGDGKSSERPAILDDAPLRLDITNATYKHHAVLSRSFLVDFSSGEVSINTKLSGDAMVEDRVDIG